jgi:hypothetical protein
MLMNKKVMSLEAVAPVMGSEDQSKDCTVTNITTTDVVVVLPIQGETPGPTNSATVVKNTTLEVLNTTAGTPVIAKGASGTVVLDMMFKDPKTGAPKWSQLYDLIVSDSSWYMPVANHSVSSIVGPFKPVTASLSDATAMKQAAKFHQTIMAYPNSKLAKDYVAAMQQAQTDAVPKADGSASSSQNVADSLGDSVQKFFEETKSFQKVTLPVLVAMEDYYRDFSFVWGQFSSPHYNIYKSTGDLLGTLVFKKPASLDVTQDNGGYTVTYLSSDKKTNKNLIYSGGLFVDDADSDTPSIAIKGTFQLKGIIDSTSDQTMITVLTGVVGVDTCLGVDFEIKKKEDEKTASQIFDEIMKYTGYAVLLGMIAHGLYSLCKSSNAKKTPTTEDQFEKMTNDMKATIKEEVDAAVKKISGGKGEAIPDNPAEALDEMGAAKTRVQAAENAEKIQETLEAEADTLEQLDEFAGDMTPEQLKALEGHASDLKDIKTALDEAQFKDLPDVVKAQTSKMGELKTNIEDFVSEVDEHLSDQAKEQIAENKATSDDLAKEIEESQAEEEGEAGEDGGDVDPIEPEVI